MPTAERLKLAIHYAISLRFVVGYDVSKRNRNLRLVNRNLRSSSQSAMHRNEILAYDLPVGSYDFVPIRRNLRQIVTKSRSV